MPQAAGNARIAVEIEVAAILARSKDRVGERGGSRREQEWQEPRSRAKRAEANDTAYGRGLARAALWDTVVISGLAFVEEEMEAERAASCGPR